MRGMRYFLLKPAIDGELGQKTEMDYTVIPPRVIDLHYNMDSWDGDALVVTFVDNFLLTTAAARALTQAGLTGMSFDKAHVTRSVIFREIHPGRRLPRFVWFRPNGTAGVDDFGVSNRHLIVSKRALDLLKQLGIPGTREIEPYSA